MRGESRSWKRMLDSAPVLGNRQPSQTRTAMITAMITTTTITDTTMDMVTARVEMVMAV